MLETKENEYTQDMYDDGPPPPPYNPEWTQSVSSAPPPAAYNPEYHEGGDSFRSTTSAPARLNDSYPTPDGFPPFPFDDYYVPPFASAVPVGAATTVPVGAATTANSSVPTMNHPVPTHVEHVIMEREQATPPPPTTTTTTTTTTTGAKAHPSNARSRFVRVHRRRGCFLKPYARKLAWKTYRVSKMALTKTVKATKEQVVPKVKQLANRSASLVKETSQRSASLVKETSQRSSSFVKEASQKSASLVVEFNEKHQVVPKARYTVKMMGRKVKRASLSTARSIRNLETKHHLWSRNGGRRASI